MNRSRKTSAMSQKLQYDPYLNPDSNKQIKCNSKQKLDI